MVEGHIKKVDDLFVSINYDFKAIRFEHLADFFFGFFKFKFKFQVQVQVYYYFFNFFRSHFADCETIVTIRANFILEFGCYQGHHEGSY